MARCGFVLLVLALPIATAQAQFPEARVGERIRFEAPDVVDGRYTGTVLRRTADTLLVGSPDAPPVGVALSRITRLDVSRGRSASAGAVRGLLIGAGIGGVVGLVGTIALLNEDGTSEGSLAILVVPAVAAVEAALGGAVGSAIGAVVQREVWEGVTPANTRLGVGVRGGALRLGVQRSF